MDEKISTITIRFSKANDYRMIAATGVWGGLNAGGNLCIDFYVEKKEIPESVTLQLSPGSIVETARIGESTVREMQMGMELRPDIAYSIGAWLIDQAKKAGVQEIKPGTN